MSLKKTFPTTKQAREEIDALLRRGSAPARVVRRARIIAGLMDGGSGLDVARENHCRTNTVYTWRDRYLRDGIGGLDDRARSGQPRKLTAEKTKEVLDATMHTLPRDATRWSLRRMAEHTGLTRHLVATVWSAAKLKPHLSSTFNFSNDPEFAEKVIDIVGLYMSPPQDAIVLSVDEKTQIQALDHTQPLLQLRPGQVERHTHDYVRHGTTSLYAAFDILSGRAIGRCAQRHRAAEFISFMNLVARRMETRKNHGQIHVILDNSSTHKTKEVVEWLRAHPAFHFHFTPTSSSWLNAVESWFSRVERFGLRGKAFRSVRDLRDHLKDFIVSFNRHSAKPFVWTKDANAIFESVEKAKTALAMQTEREPYSKTSRTGH